MPFEELEYEALQAEKRDKLNARWQVWSILVGLAGVFGLASLQAGATGYVIALYPFVAACLARFSAHSESVLDQIKRYLLKFEAEHQYAGYEHYNQDQKRTSAGSQRKALRDALFCTDALATLVLVLHLAFDHLFPLAIVACLVEGVVIWQTVVWLHEG